MFAPLDATADHHFTRALDATAWLISTTAVTRHLPSSRKCLALVVVNRCMMRYGSIGLDREERRGCLLTGIGSVIRMRRNVSVAFERRSRFSIKQQKSCNELRQTLWPAWTIAQDLNQGRRASWLRIEPLPVETDDAPSGAPPEPAHTDDIREGSAFPNVSVWQDVILLVHRPYTSETPSHPDSTRA